MMSFRPCLFAAALVCLTLLSAPIVTAQTNSQRDAVIGGVAGAIIGGIAGNQNDETPEGIAIGGVAGAIAGHVIGKAKDRNLEEEYFYQQQAIQAAQQQQIQQEYQQAVQLQKAISIQDAIALSNSGVSPQLIINQIHSNGVQQEIGVSEIITLHQNGVSELFINEMQQAHIGAGVSPAIIPHQPAAVIAHQPAVVVKQPVLVKPAVVVKPTPVFVGPPIKKGPTIVLQTGKSNHGGGYRGKSHYRPPTRSARGYGHPYKGGHFYR